MRRVILATVLAFLVVAGTVWVQNRFTAFPDGATRGKFAYFLYLADRSRATDPIIHVSIPIGAEDCAGYDRDFFHSGGFQTAANPVGYLTGRPLDRFEVDHVVALHEAWCSGVRDPAFGTDPDNLRASDPSVNRGKGGRDPREWWDTDGKTTPRKVDYPGWCDYLTIHLAVKDEYDAAMDKAEWDFVTTQLAACE